MANIRIGNAMQRAMIVDSVKIFVFVGDEVFLYNCDASKENI